MANQTENPTPLTEAEKAALMMQSQAYCDRMKAAGFMQEDFARELVKFLESDDPDSYQLPI